MAKEANTVNFSPQKETTLLLKCSFRGCWLNGYLEKVANILVIAKIEKLKHVLLNILKQNALILENN